MSFFFIYNFTAANPDFNADCAVGSIGGSLRIIDISAQCMKRYAALMILFRAGDFSAAQTTATDNLDTFRATFHRSSDRFFHSPAERNAPFQLTGNLLSH